MREDTAGLFWDDTPPPRETKPAPPKRQPPPQTWRLPGYLPHLEEARRFPVPLFTTAELQAAAAAREPLAFDSECFGNYWLVAFTSIVTGKVIYFELREGGTLDIPLLTWVLHNFTLVGFNSTDYDLPIIALALAGLDCATLKQATNKIIVEQIKAWLVLRSHKVKPLRVDHIDLISVCPLQASLKIYAARVHAPRIQELPFDPDWQLDEDQITIVRWYCVNDLTCTAFLFMELRPHLELRVSMSAMYGVDLRSKSDAQIAEAVLVHELTRINYSKPTRPEIPAGTMFCYKVPSYINYQTDALRSVLAIVASADFIVEESGYVEMPKDLNELAISIGGGVYRMGMGGLHSSETCVAHFSDAQNVIVDRDVSSYYPAIILNQELYPKHLGPNFLTVYKELVDRRLAAKKDPARKTEAATLKITINGSFGKLGNKWSVLYAPDLMIQVTITGQLTLLMLIERLELAGIPVVSGNTDGIICKLPRSDMARMETIARQWEIDTGFLTEQSIYEAVFCRDVNNYIAVKGDGSHKVKGEYAERGSAGDSVLSKNPVNLICNDAVLEFVKWGKPIVETIRQCRDIRRFITIRTVKGGAVKDGEYLGKAIRWYYAAGETGEIIYALNGNKVPNSDGARPMMDLPYSLPPDIDYERYERDALSILSAIGYPSTS